ncbi:MAG: AMP-binding protein [Microbacteriaceae bacterium]
MILPNELPRFEREAFQRALHDGMVVETSGSIAKPKRVRLSAVALRASAEATTGAIGSGNWVLALPLTYIAGIMVVVRSLVDDTELVDLRAEPFDAAKFSAAVTNLRAGTWFTSLVPAQLARLVDLGESARAAFTRFGAILVGGQAIPAGLVDRATALGARVIRTYGSAETSGGVVYNGRPIGDTKLRITDDGVLEVSTSSLASGYLDDPGGTASSFVDGWFRTSDLAHFEHGALVIDGRVDDIIVTGGVKVSIADIERVLAESGIDAVATWYVDEEWGQVPAVVSTAELDLDAIRSRVGVTLGKAARPYRVARVDAIPRLTSGKVDRHAVQQFISQATRPNL